jgi:uncharacterized membrane protein
MEADMEAYGEVPKPALGAEQPRFRVRRVPLDAPWEWLSLGWRDLCAAPSVSLAYGAFFTAMAWIILLVLSQLEAKSLVPVLGAGFLLIAPLLAAGLYEISRRLEKHEPVTLRAVFDTCAPALARVAFFGIALFFAFFLWVELSFVLLALFLGGAALPDPSEFMQKLLFTNAGLGLLFAGTLTGGMLAAMVFSVASVAVPLLLVKDVDPATAMATSVRATSLNSGAMLLWAALITGFMALGLATLFVGLIIIFPLLGHATWHAFRALVDVDDI